MEFDIRPLNANDYDDILVGWWKDWRWVAPERDFLPEDGTGGLIVYDGETPVCAGFLYNTNSKVTWIEWVISNFEYKDREKRADALSLLVETLTNISRNLGNKFCYALIKNKGLIGVYTKSGYISGDAYNKEMIKVL